MSDLLRDRASQVHSKGVQKQDFIRDFRLPGQKISDWIFNHATNTIVVLCVMAFLAFFVSSFFFYISPIATIIIGETALSAHKRKVMPYRVPIHGQEKKIDYGQPIPGTGDSAFFPAQGTIYLGNEKNTNEQVWCSQADLLTHSLYLGTTGAGKTEELISLAANIMSTGSGLMYVDAKSAPSLYVQLSAIARRLGREDDLLVINYLTGNTTVGLNTFDRHAKKLTNDNNPFTSGSADSLVQLLKSFMPSDDGGANNVFANKAEAMIQPIIYALHDLRENDNLNLTAQIVGQYLTLVKIHELSENRKISEKSRLGVVNYLRTIPGYDDTKPINEQSQTTLDQHGYSQMYFALAITSLQDAYGHIYWTAGGAVDFTDVVLNNRILIVMLPSLEKSQGELKTLATLNLFGIKNAVSTGLGSKLEGDTDDVLYKLPSSSGRTMCLNINDEFGYMAVKGFAVVPAQARGLGLGVCFAGQDWSGFKRADEGEAGQIWGNCRFKHFLALEDEETMKKMKEAFGSADVMVSKDLEYNSGMNLMESYNAKSGISFDKVERIDNIDLLQQLEGESHSSLRGRLMRIASFYANIDIDAVFGKGVGESFLNQTAYIGHLLSAEAQRLTKASTDGNKIKNLKNSQTNSTESFGGGGSGPQLKQTSQKVVSYNKSSVDTKQKTQPEQGVVEAIKNQNSKIIKAPGTPKHNEGDSTKINRIGKTAAVDKDISKRILKGFENSKQDLIYTPSRRKIQREELQVKKQSESDNDLDVLLGSV